MDGLRKRYWHCCVPNLCIKYFKKGKYVKGERDIQLQITSTLNIDNKNGKKMLPSLQKTNQQARLSDKHADSGKSPFITHCVHSYKLYHPPLFV